MSQRRERFESFDIGTALDRIEEWYQVPALALLLGFMLWTRARTWQNFVVDGQVLFSGNDPWYHFRQTSYTVRNWPRTMPYDIWSGFSEGAISGQFGTLFDQIVATVALIVGLGDPSGETIRMTLLFAPAVFGTVAAIPIYLIGRRLGGRFAGVVAVLVLALSAGGFLNRSLVGFSDHHVAEALFQFTAVLGVMVAVAVAQREKPVYELLVQREFDALRRPLGWGILGGVAIALYIWTWPPSVLIIGILGVYFLVQLNADYVRGESPEHVAFAGAATLGTAGILALVPFTEARIGATAFTFLQPGLALAVAAGCVFMAWLAREWDDRDLSPLAYPTTVFGIILAGATLMALALPNLFDFFVKQTLRVVGFTTSPTAGTVGEAQPLSRPIAQLFRRYGLAFVTAGAGGILLLAKQVRSSGDRADQLLVVIWGLFMGAATLTQARFDYYLVGPIAVLNGYLVVAVIGYVSPGVSLRDVEAFQVLTVGAVLLLITAPMVASTSQGATTALGRSQANGPGNGIQGWEGSLEWMANNTAPEGTYGGADNGMDFYATVPRTSDYDYPEGAYGVISWWDYGHWITTTGERIPVANPFQQNARNAAAFLMADSEEQANAVLAGVDEGDAQTRYVMIDWKMANPYAQFGGKLFAPPVFNRSVNQSDLYQPVFNRQGRFSHYVRSQRFYETMVARLWLFHGSAAEPRPFVLDWDLVQGRNGRTFRVAPQGGPALRTFRNVSAAREFVADDGSARVGGVGANPEQRVEALEHYRLVHNSNVSAFQESRRYTATVRTESRALNLTNLRQVSQLLLGPGAATPWTKTFERVPGATVEGTGPPNTNVTASVRMFSPNTNSTFTYRQRARTGPDGEFNMTVPYSTTGYDNWGPQEGYTNVSVRATGPYVFSTSLQRNESGAISRWFGTANVTEGQVIGENGSATRVTMQEQVLAPPPSANETENGTSGNATSGARGNELPSLSAGPVLATGVPTQTATVPVRAPRAALP